MVWFLVLEKSSTRLVLAEIFAALHRGSIHRNGKLTQPILEIPAAWILGVGPLLDFGDCFAGYGMGPVCTHPTGRWR